MITLYGVFGSPYVRKVLFVLAVKKLEFKHIQQMPFTRDVEYQKINPLGKIPSLQDGELTLCDSTVICEYLEEAYPANPVYPADIAGRARARWLEELAGSRVSEYAAGIFFQRFMRPMMKQEPDEVLIEKITSKQLPPLLDYLEAQVPAEGFLFGDNIALADVCLLCPFINAGYAGYQVDAARWPGFAGFLQRVKADPVMGRILVEEAAAMGMG